MPMSILSRDAIEKELEKPWFQSPAPELMRLHDSEEAHYSYARKTIIISAIAYMMVVFVEPFLIENILVFSIVTRLIITPMVVFIILFFIDRRRPLMEVHLAMGLSSVLGTGTWSYMLLNGTYQGPPYYFLASFTFFLAPNIFMQLKFSVAVASNFLIIAILIFDAIHLKDTSHILLIVDLIILLNILVFTLLTNWQLNQKSYTIFLHRALAVLDKRDLTRRNDELLSISMVDALTGIGNRRAADAIIEELWFDRMKPDGSFALLIIDVDYFKLFNDHYGHGAGDDCLRAIAAVTQSAAAQFGCSVFRLGGEEFLIATKCSRSEQAVQVGEAVLGAIYRENIAHAFRPDGLRRVSVSIGAALSGDVAASIKGDVLHAADVSLYRAKSRGRNCLELHPPRA